MIKVLIKEKLRREFSPTHLTITDESKHHLGHANYRPGGNSHFSVTIVSSLFCGMSRIQRHQKVYACLEEELKAGIHALRLKILCPEEGESPEVE
jgi:BolA protein